MPMLLATREPGESFQSSTFGARAHGARLSINTERLSVGAVQPENVNNVRYR